MNALVIRRKVLLVFALALPAGCRDVLDVKGYGSTVTGRCERIPYYFESCQRCMDHSCCAEAKDCAADPACTALTTCLAKCEGSEVGCRTKCHLSVRRTSAASALIACAAKECTMCAAARAAPGGQACAQCLEDTAPKSVETFSKNVDALEWESCLKDCPPGYEDRCTCTTFAGGRGAYEALQNVPNCTGFCSDPDWSCLGSVEWPPLQPSMRPSLELHVGAAPVSNSTTQLVGAAVTQIGRAHV